LEPGSFRDPAGYVFHYENRVLRALSARGVEAFFPILQSDLLREWETRGVAVKSRAIELGDPAYDLTGELPMEVAGVLEHSRIPYISYPYEWPFGLLKKAALLHLDLQIEALDAGFSFSDSSAYNIQFIGAQPLLMDVLSLRPYVEGEYWSGYRQFCEQFLNPLLLTSEAGIPFGAWYRGNLSGIPVIDTARAIPAIRKLKPKVLLHVALHARLMESAGRLDGTKARTSPMSKVGLRAMLTGMRRWIASLEPRGADKTFWADYENRNSYDADQAQVKRALVAKYVGQVQPKMLFDLGCNSGDYSELALESGAASVVGFDFDAGALAAAVSRSSEKGLNFLPLHLDISNPSPNQGWRQLERMGFDQRAHADGLVALALIHHLVIGANIPMRQAVDWLLNTAPTGVVEFVPKSDPMVIGMLANREDIFVDYTTEHFRSYLAERVSIVEETAVGTDGRVLFRYQARQ